MQKNNKKEPPETEADKEAKKPFLLTPTGLATLAALATLLTAIAALITAITPIILTPTPPATSTVTPIVVPTTLPRPDLCPLYYSDLPIYESTVGVPQQIAPKGVWTKPFALKFIESGKHIGGMKLEWNTGGWFEVYGRADENCFDTGSNGKKIILQAGVANEFQYNDGVIYTLVMSVEGDDLKVSIKRK